MRALLDADSFFYKKQVILLEPHCSHKIVLIKEEECIYIYKSQLHIHFVIPFLSSIITSEQVSILPRKLQGGDSEKKITTTTPNHHPASSHHTASSHHHPHFLHHSNANNDQHQDQANLTLEQQQICLLYTSPSPRDS